MIANNDNPLELKKSQLKLAISNRLNKTLKRKNLKKKDLALMMNRNTSEISRWFSGTHNFTLDTIAEIENCLEVDLLNPKTEYCNPCNTKIKLTK